MIWNISRGAALGFAFSLSLFLPPVLQFCALGILATVGAAYLAKWVFQ